MSKPKRKSGWVVYHKKKDAFMARNNKFEFIWVEGFDKVNITEGFRPIFGFTQNKAVREFNRCIKCHGASTFYYSGRFKLETFHNIILARATGDEEAGLVETTDFAWTVHIGRFYKDYIVRFGYPYTDRLVEWGDGK